MNISCRRPVFTIYNVVVMKKKTGVDKAWLRKLVAANQFISDKSRNKVFVNNSWFTVDHMTIS